VHSLTICASVRTPPQASKPASRHNPAPEGLPAHPAIPRPVTRGNNSNHNQVSRANNPENRRNEQPASDVTAPLPPIKSQITEWCDNYRHRFDPYREPFDWERHWAKVRIKTVSMLCMRHRANISTCMRPATM
jgi:hypothetical protein